MTATTEQPIRILAVAGSLREESVNRRLVRLAARLAPEGVELVEFDALGAVEPYDEDLEAERGFPPGAAAFAAAIREADALFIATPEYNGSVPGQLKNALDWASRPDGAIETDAGGLPASPLYGVPVGVASASTGQFGAVWARDELAKVLRTQGARPIIEPSVTVPTAHQAFDDDGDLTTAATRERLVQLLDEVAAMVRLLREAAARQAERAAAQQTAAAS
jgi:chromate reductase